MSRYRFIIYGVTSDGEPQATPFILAYATTLQEVQQTAVEFDQSADFYVTIYDRETESYI